MTSPAIYVVSLDVSDDNTAALSLRVNDQWVYVETSPRELRNRTIQKLYNGLIQEYRDSSNADAPEEKNESKTTDSGYVSTDDAPAQKSNETSDDNDGAERLQAWMLDAVRAPCHTLCKSGTRKRKRSLADWYTVPTRCFTIEARANDAKRLTIIPHDDWDCREYAHDQLTPHISLPKYIQKLDIPSYAAEDLQVEEEDDNIHLSIHPTIVSIPTKQVPSNMQALDTPKPPSTLGKRKRASTAAASNRTSYFLKLATPEDADAVKREIRSLDTLRKKDLYSKGVRAPRLAGLVRVPRAHQEQDTKHTSKGEILGFLLTMIPQPSTPLIHYMDSSVKKGRRVAFAEEAQTMVDCLHKHNLVWGDAKADNFLVDGHGKLWMIDFGGSVTPGWVDADLADTMAGDDMGTYKISVGLKDPEGCVVK